MAPQDLSVSRAVFTSALLRSDAPAPDVPREDATLFIKTVLKTLNCCTSSDVKQCKSFIIKNILPSDLRTAALAKYLITLAKAAAPRASGEKVDTTKTSDETEGLGRIINGRVTQAPDPAFRRLHALYIVHDIFCHLYGRLRDDTHFGKVKINLAIVERHLKPCALILAELAASGGNSSGASAGAKTAVKEVNALIGLWSSEALSIFTVPIMAELRTNVDAAAITTLPALIEKMDLEDREKAEDEKRKKEDETKWILPERHGLPNDPTAPWHELPAANGLYQKRTRGYPLNAASLPQGGYLIKDGGKEADEQLKKETLAIIKEVKSFHQKYTNHEEVADIDPLGNIVWKDPERPTRNYWGWSYEGIEKRRKVAEDSLKHLEEKARAEGARAPSMDDPVARARELAAARGFGGSGDFSGGGGRGRGRGGRGSRY